MTDATELARDAAACFSTAAGENILDALIRDNLAQAAPAGADALELARREGARRVVLHLLQLREAGRAGERRSSKSIVARIRIALNI